MSGAGPRLRRTHVFRYTRNRPQAGSCYLDPATVGAKTGIGTVRYPRLEPLDAGCATKLKKRTLTNLYNGRPARLDPAHRNLDAAVAAVYGFEMKYADAPGATKPMHTALADLGLAHLRVIYPGEQRYDLTEKITAVPARDIPILVDALKAGNPLRG